MRRKPFILFFFLLSLWIGFFQTIAVRFNIYYFLPWIDTMMHFLGGVWVACALFAFYRFAQKENVLKRGTLYVILVLSVLCVGILWELLEVYLAVPVDQKPSRVIDTLSDIIFDTLGGLTASFILLRGYIKKDANS